VVDHPGAREDHPQRLDRPGARDYAPAAQAPESASARVGGKSPNIVFEEADMGEGLRQARSPHRSRRHRPDLHAGSRLVQNSIREEVSKRVEEWPDKRKGDPMLADTNIGPGPRRVIPRFRHMEICESPKGARCILGGGAAREAACRAGQQFVEPTIFVDVRPEIADRPRGKSRRCLSIIGARTRREAVSRSRTTRSKG